MEIIVLPGSDQEMVKELKKTFDRQKLFIIQYFWYQFATFQKQMAKIQNSTCGFLLTFVDIYFAG